MAIESWIVFCSIALLATITPGPAVLIVTTHSLQYGPIKSIATILGNITGLFLMSLASVLGISTIILYSSAFFSAVKFAGAVYLIYLGIKVWRGGIVSREVSTVGHRQVGGLNRFGQGLAVALTNPKAIAFTTALFPQFIVQSAPLAGQFTILVLTFMSLSFICLLIYAVASHKAKEQSVSMISGKGLGRVFGCAFIGAGLALASTSQK